MPATRDGKLWRSQFYYKDWQGVRRKKNKRGFKTKGEADEWERNFLQQQQKNLDISFENFVEIYFADMEKYKCAIILIGHMNKAAGNKAAYRGMGSIDFFAVARSVLLVGRIEGQKNTRAVVQIKNNLAAFGHSKAFELTEEGFHWLGDYEITADELLGGITPKANKKERAKQLIYELAETNSVVKSEDIVNLAEEKGISKRTLENAKKELGIKGKRIGESWYWKLDEIVKP